MSLRRAAMASLVVWPILLAVSARAPAAPVSAAALPPPLAASLPVPARLEDSVVRVLVSKKSVDTNSPWQFEEVEQQTHLSASAALNCEKPQ